MNNLQQKPTRIRWLIFALACGTSWFLYLHRYTFNLIRPQLQDEYGFNNTQLDSIYSMFSLSYMLGQVPGGVLCDIFGSHFFLAIIIVVWSLLLPVFGLTGNSYGLAGIWLGFGAAQAGCYPGITKITRVWFPTKIRTILQGIVASFFGRGGGAASSIIMGTLLMGVMGLGWRVALVVMAAAGVLFGIVFAMLFRNRPEDDARVNQAERDLIRAGETALDDGPQVLPAGRVLRSVSMRVFIFQQIMNAGADTIYVYLMGSFFQDKFASSLTTAGLLISLPLWGGAVGGIVGGFINDGLIQFTGSRRWSRAAAGFTGKFLAAVFLMVAINQTVGAAAAWCLFVVKFFSDWTQPTVWGTCTDMGGRYSATVFSIINTSGGVGGIAIPPIFGLILDYCTTPSTIDGTETLVTNYTPIFFIVGGMYLASALCWLLIDCTKSLEKEDRNAAVDA